MTFDAPDSPKVPILPPALPSTPSFGDALPIEPSPETIRFLTRRRSASALSLTAPGPGVEDLAAILALAARTPDHGKLSPWRFIVLQGAAKATFVKRLEAIAATRPDAPKAEAKLGKIRVPPLTVAVVSRYTPGEIPEWEQRLSAGSVCTLMVIAAHARGYGANWITDWYAYDEAAGRLMGLTTNERVAGFVHIGTAAQAPLERIRPDMNAIVSEWTES